MFLGETWRLHPSFNIMADSNTDRYYTQEATLWSVYAQADINFTDALTLTIGGRYNQEDKEGRRQLDIFAGPTNTGITIPLPPELPYPTALHAGYAQLNMYEHVVDSDRDEDSFDPLVNLQYRWNDDINDLYLLCGRYQGRAASTCAATRLPGHPVAVPGTWEFEDEAATSYEIGAKFAYDRSELNLALFYTEYEDLQTQIFDGTLNFLVTNASESTNKGIEADGRYLVSENLELYGSVAYLDFEYDSFEDGQCAYPLRGSCSLTGERASFTPEWTGNFGLDFNYNVGDSLMMDANLNINYSDSYYQMANLDKNSKQDSYTTVRRRYWAWAPATVAGECP